MTRDELLNLYRRMLLLRRFDELCLALKMKDLIFSGYHPYVGQEAVAVGFCSPLRTEDVLLSTHRAHCHAVAKGSPVRGVLAEMMGRPLLASISRAISTLIVSYERPSSVITWRTLWPLGHHSTW